MPTLGQNLLAVLFHPTIQNKCFLHCPFLCTFCIAEERSWSVQWLTTFPTGRNWFGLFSDEPAAHWSLQNIIQPGFGQ
jgi:hypothetical protein